MSDDVTGNDNELEEFDLTKKSPLDEELEEEALPLEDDVEAGVVPEDEEEETFHTYENPDIDPEYSY